MMQYCRKGSPVLPELFAQLGPGSPVPPWLAESPWAAILSSGPALERLLQSLTCSAAWLLLQGARFRQSQVLACNAVCYMLRSVRTRGLISADTSVISPLQASLPASTLCILKERRPRCIDRYIYIVFVEVLRNNVQMYFDNTKLKHW